MTNRHNKRNYGVFPFIAAVGAALLALFGLPIVFKVWQIMFSKPTSGSIPTWAFVVIGIIIVIFISRRNRRGSYI